MITISLGIFLMFPAIMFSTTVAYGSSQIETNSNMHIAIVVCGTEDRVEETIVNIKSAVLLSQQFLIFHIFTEDHLKQNITARLEEWPEKAKSKFHVNIYSIQYPEDGHAPTWKKLFKLCASQRLFLPHLLKDVELLLYVDTDILFLSPVDEIWKFFENFNSSHVSAMAPEHDQKSISWYYRFARHPFYGTFGINSGVMLMNMSRIRQTFFKNDLQTNLMAWDEMLLPLYKKYRLNITWGDQDLLNIIFHFNPEKLLVFPCHWNYRPDHCMYMQICRTAEEHGVKIFHGCRRAFHNEKWPSFKAVYSAVKFFNFDDDASNLLIAASNNVENVNKTNCKEFFKIMLKGLQTIKDEL